MEHRNIGNRKVRCASMLQNWVLKRLVLNVFEIKKLKILKKN